MEFLMKIKAFFLAVIAFFSGLFGIGGGNTPVDPPVTPVETTGIVRFVVASDVHVDDKYSEQEEARLAKLFTTAYEYASEQEYKNLDGAFFAGDIANTGTLSSMKKYFGIVNANVKSGTTTRTVLGNHEFITDSANTYSRFLEASGYDSADAHFTVNGYHFIMLAPDKGGRGFSSDKQAWLDAELEKAVADDPTGGRKPIFVFQHHHVKNTVYGSISWGISDLYNVLSKYPQVIDFSGHSHYPVNDPTSIWQGTFTALGTGTLSYYEMGIAGVANGSIYADGLEGAYTTNGPRTRDAAQYLIVEVNEDLSITIKGYDLLSDTIICEYNLPSVGNTSEFIYTNDRPMSTAVPTFAAGTEISIDRITEDIVALSIPQATSESNVQHYRFEVYDGTGKKINTIYRLSDTFYFPTPDRITCNVTDLVASADYTIKCYAVSSWCVESAPLTLSFTAPAGHTDAVAMRETAIVPDVFSFVAMDDGCAYDGVSDNKIAKVGVTATRANEKAGQNEAVFNGKTAYTYPAFENSYDAVKSSFTFEYYGKPEAFTGGYNDIFSNMETGGLGFELTEDGEMQFWAHLNGSYKVAEADIEFGEAVHCVATYDGTAIRLYINGVLADTVNATGDIKFPENSTARHLCIGADSATNNDVQCYFTGTVAVANVYSTALPAEDVMALYNGLK